VSQSVTELRSTLVRVVRTSMTEVDRRLAERVPVDLAARAEIGGRMLDIHLRNLSAGGALAAPADGLARGARGRFTVPGASALDFSVLDISTDGAHLLFDDE